MLLLLRRSARSIPLARPSNHEPCNVPEAVRESPERIASSRRDLQSPSRDVFDFGPQQGREPGRVGRVRSRVFACCYA